MHSDTLASSSRLVIDPHWGSSLGTRSFPISNLRSADRRSTTTPPIIPPPPNLALPDRTTSGNVPASKYSTDVPRRTQIGPGVWSDGRNRVLSAACPDVQAFLTCAREEMNLPVAPSEPVFALAALEVFYRVDDPVHWMFWSERRKDETANVVNRISLHRPPLIQSRVAWNGVSEYLFILASLHGPTSSPLYEAKEWYLILNPPKATSPPRVPNLRKRKPQQAGLRETPGSVDQEGIDEEEPPAKKPRTKRPPNSKKPRGSKEANESVTNERQRDISPAISSISVPDNDFISTGGHELPVHELPSLAPRAAARNSKRKAQTPPVTNCPTLPAPATILTPAFVSHSRNRSTSQTSSQTLVSERRSVSVLSALTTVEAPTGEKEGILMSKCDQVDETSESEGKPDSESGMVTRGRASKARATGGKGGVVEASTRSRARGKAKRNAK